MKDINKNINQLMNRNKDKMLNLIIRDQVNNYVMYLTLMSSSDYENLTK